MDLILDFFPFNFLTEMNQSSNKILEFSQWLEQKSVKSYWKQQQLSEGVVQRCPV